MKRITLLFVLLLAVSGSGCIQHVMDQGNVLKPDLIVQIKEGDTRFKVESLIGTPVLEDVLNPNRSMYIEDYDNPDTGEAYRRSVEIIYDEANTVTRITITGFRDEPQE